MRFMLGMVLAISMLVGGYSAAQAQDQPRDPAEAFKRMDKDNNGTLSLEEFVGRREGEQAERAKKQFTQLDKDKNGQLTLEEFKARMRPN